MISQDLNWKQSRKTCLKLFESEKSLMERLLTILIPIRIAFKELEKDSTTLIASFIIIDNLLKMLNAIQGDELAQRLVQRIRARIHYQDSDLCTFLHHYNNPNSTLSDDFDTIEIFVNYHSERLKVSFILNF